jgi:hypothetical protein
MRCLVPRGGPLRRSWAKGASALDRGGHSRPGVAAVGRCYAAHSARECRQKDLPRSTSLVLSFFTSRMRPMKWQRRRRSEMTCGSSHLCHSSLSGLVSLRRCPGAEPEACFAHLRTWHKQGLAIAADDRVTMIPGHVEQDLIPVAILDGVPPRLDRRWPALHWAGPPATAPWLRRARLGPLRPSRGRRGP